MIQKMGRIMMIYCVLYQFFDFRSKFEDFISTEKDTYCDFMESFLDELENKP